MAYSFTDFKDRAGEVINWLTREFTGIRTGRATLAVLDQVSVEVYGSRQPIKHIANLGIEDSRTIRLVPWDKSQTKAIESALSSANIGLSVVADGEGLRIIFPELTSERREQFIKVVKAKLEEARVSLRKEREKTLDDLNVKEKSGELNEDEKFRAREELQKLVDNYNDQLATLAEKKEVELRS